MAEAKKKATKPRATAAKAGAPKAAAPAKAKRAPVAAQAGLAIPQAGLSLDDMRPNDGARPKRTRVGRGHGSGMVKTSGKGGKGQTVRSGRGKGPAFEGGQTPWARRLPHRLGYSQKARDIGHFRSTLAVINLADLADWDASVPVTPETLKEKGKLKALRDGVKVLGGTKPDKTLPSGLVFQDILFSASAREALSAAGAKFEDVQG
jgi:large subunit ribosomal protein L15